MIRIVTILQMIPPSTMYGNQQKFTNLLQHLSIDTNDNPLTYVNSIFDQPENPVKTYSSCRFPSEYY